jgi:hypothetical protein
VGRYSLVAREYDHVEGDVDHPPPYGEPRILASGREEPITRRRARDSALELEDGRDHRQWVDRFSILVDGLQSAGDRLVYPPFRHSTYRPDFASSASGWGDLVPSDESRTVRARQVAQESG